jgi:hypothetical protein
MLHFGHTRVALDDAVSACSLARRVLARYSSQLWPRWKGTSQDRHQRRWHSWQLKMLPASFAKKAPMDHVSNVVGL